MYGAVIVGVVVVIGAALQPSASTSSTVSATPSAVGDPAIGRWLTSARRGAASRRPRRGRCPARHRVRRVLVLLAQILNVVVFTYGKGTVRTALDEAARAGARDGLAACEATADQVIGDLLGGALGADVQISCTDAGRRIVATADVHFDGWLTSLADYDGTFAASAAKEDR